MGPEQITTEWLSSTLGEEVSGFETSRIGDGLVGMNLRIGVQYASDEAAGPRSVVVKLPSPDPTSRATGLALRNYEREVRFYSDVASTVDVRVPTCHAAAWDETGDFVLLLEDLAPAEQGDQITGCPVDQARTAVLELARLHGPRWDDPTLHDIEWLSRRSGPDDAQMLAGFWAMVFPGFMATYAKHLTREAIELIETFGTRLVEWVDGREGPLTVTHGDYRLDNLMFESASGGPSIAVVDWQSPGHGPGSSDLSYFLGAGLLPEQRRSEERGLVEEYRAALGGYGIELDPEWLWEQYRRDAFSGVVMSVVASQIVGSSDRSEAMFAAMATRHSQHALDLDSLAAI